MTTRVHRLPLRRSDVLLVDDGRDSMLVVGDGDATHLLNPTARAIWELCDGSTHPREMVDAICDVFEVPRGVAAADVEAALEQLTHFELVRWNEQERGDE